MIDKEFLADYTPDNGFFTSEREIKLVEGVLKLEGKTKKEANDILMEVLEYYGYLMDMEERDSFRYWELEDAMLSVQAVIENYIKKLEIRN